MEPLLGRLSFSRTVTPELERAAGSLGVRGVKTQIAGPNLGVSDSVDLGWAREPEFLIRVNSGADTDAAGPGTPLWEPLPTLEE